MGLLSWLFPSKDDKLAQAHAALAAGRFADARMTAEDLGDHPGAAELILQAEEALTRKNLDDVYGWIQAGDLNRAREQLEIADELCPRHLEFLLQAADAAVRTADAQQKAQKKAEQQAQNSKLFDVNPSFKTANPDDQIALPEGVSEAEAEALKARLAILVDGYPESLRHRFVELGSAFASAVIDLEDGQIDRAAVVLDTLPQDDALVRYERARVHLSRRDPLAAATDLRTFAELAGGHFRVGNTHSAVLLAQALAMSGEHTAAVSALEDANAHNLDVGAGLYAALLEYTGRLADADRVLRALLTKFGSQPHLYVMLARVREKSGERIAAMRVLETCLEKCACGTGGCNKPTEPDIDAYRMLATLYLEDGLETPRALELADTARSMVQQPVWEDVYLAALAARKRQDDTWSEMASQLRTGTPAGDPRLARLEQHLAVA
jgi:tetratricopeptide (TPR) repeat protein